MNNYTIPSLIPLLYPSCTWKVKTADKKVFFTFDDGPHPKITPWVLQQLKQFNATATFFCVGANVERYPETYRQLIEEGHTVGNHSFNHLNGWKTNTQTYIENIEKAAGFIDSSLLRPPYGRIRPAQLRALKKKYAVIMWNRLSCDYDKTLNLNESLTAMKQLPAAGNIFVFHDSEKAFDNLKVLLPELLNFFSGQGYSFCGITKT